MLAVDKSFIERIWWWWCKKSSKWSGEQHWPGVPTAPVFNSPGKVVWLFSFTLQPKSPSFTEPFSVRNIFAPNHNITRIHTQLFTTAHHSTAGMLRVEMASASRPNIMALPLACYLGLVASGLGLVYAVASASSCVASLFFGKHCFMFRY